MALTGKPRPIYAEHSEELGISQRTLYNYIDAGVLSVKNIDLRRKTGYRPRNKKYEPSLGFSNQRFRKGRSYDDFQVYMVMHWMICIAVTFSFKLTE